MVKHVCSYWFVVTPDNKGIVYHVPALSAKQAYQRAGRVLGTPAYTRKQMLLSGFRAVKLDLIEVFANEVEVG